MSVAGAAAAKIGELGEAACRTDLLPKMCFQLVFRMKSEHKKKLCAGFKKKVHMERTKYLTLAYPLKKHILKIHSDTYGKESQSAVTNTPPLVGSLLNESSPIPSSFSSARNNAKDIPRIQVSMSI